MGYMMPAICTFHGIRRYIQSVQKMAMQGNVLGLVLDEISLPVVCPYDCFLSERFRPATDDDLDAIEAVKALLEEVEIGDFVYL